MLLIVFAVFLRAAATLAFLQKHPGNRTESVVKHFLPNLTCYMFFPTLCFLEMSRKPCSFLVDSPNFKISPFGKQKQLTQKSAATFLPFPFVT